MGGLLINEKSRNTTSYDTKTIIVILLLVLVYPVGLILMFVWMKWPWWVKLLVALSVTLIVLVLVGIMLVAMLAAVNPKEQIEKAERVTLEKENLHQVTVSPSIKPTIRVKK